MSKPGIWEVDMDSLMDVFAEVKAERERQESLWGQQNHEPLLWNAILGEEVGEVANAILERDPANYRTELIQVAAVAIAMVQSFDRNQTKETRA